MTAMPSTTLAEAAEAWVAGAKSGSIRNRSGDVYKPSAVRGYEQALRLRVVPELGSAKLSDIRRSDLQALVDRLLAEDRDPSTIRNTLLPVRAIFRRALARGEVALNPTSGLLARAAFELRVHKRVLVAALVGRYVDPYTEGGLRELRTLLADHGRSRAAAS